MTATILEPARGNRAALEPRLARWIAGQGRSALRQMVALVSRPDVVSLAGGLPAPELFPAREYAEAVARVLADPQALQYRPTYPPLKRHVVELMARRGVPCRPEQIVVTTGAQQGLDLLCRLLLDPGGEAALETFVYTGIQQALAPLQPRLLTLSTDLERGLEVDELEERLRQGARPALLYVIPDGHNPLGVSLAPERRQRLARLARDYDFTIVEDDPYGLLSYDGEFAPPLRALAPDRVCYVGTFSKLLAPALRLGWLVLPEALVEKAIVVKDGLDLECSQLTQRAVHSYLEGIDLGARLERLRAAYGERRDAMLAALERTLPASVRFTHPRGGMFVWLELPETVDAERLLERSLAEARVAFVPGRAFAARPGAGRHTLRLSFSTLPPQQIDHAVEALAACLDALLRRE